MSGGRTEAFWMLRRIYREEEVIMLNWLIGTVNTGDNSKPWLIAICMIVSIVVVAALFIIGQRDRNDDEDVEE